jgi:hypothetical protein
MSTYSIDINPSISDILNFTFRSDGQELSHPAADVSITQDQAEDSLTHIKTEEECPEAPARTWPPNCKTAVQQAHSLHGTDQLRSANNFCSTFVLHFCFIDDDSNSGEENPLPTAS